MKKNSSLLIGILISGLFLIACKRNQQNTIQTTQQVKILEPKLLPLKLASPDITGSILADSGAIAEVDSTINPMGYINPGMLIKLPDTTVIYMSVSNEEVDSIKYGLKYHLERDLGFDFFMDQQDSNNLFYHVTKTHSGGTKEVYYGFLVYTKDSATNYILQFYQGLTIKDLRLSANKEKVMKDYKIALSFKPAN